MNARAQTYLLFNIKQHFTLKPFCIHPSKTLSHDYNIVGEKQNDCESRKIYHVAGLNTCIL